MTGLWVGYWEDHPTYRNFLVIGGYKPFIYICLNLFTYLFFIYLYTIYIYVCIQVTNFRLTTTKLFTSYAPLDDPPKVSSWFWHFCDLKSRFRQGEKTQLLEQMSLLRGEAPWRAVERDFVSSAMIYIYIYTCTCYICYFIKDIC